MSKLLRTVSFASANLKMLVIAIVFVLCGANQAFAQPSNQPSIDCPPNVEVSCLDDMSDFDAVGWVSVMDADGYSINVTYSLSAYDRCGGDVTVEQFGSSSSADDTLICDQISTPQGPGQDWGLWINGLYPTLASTDWYRWVGAPSLVFSNNGQARLVGDVASVGNTSNGWHVDMTLEDGQDWAAWSADGGLYMDNLNMNGATHTSWNFYKLVTTISRLEGFGAFEGDQLILSHQPANFAYMVMATLRLTWGVKIQINPTKLALKLLSAVGPRRTLATTWHSTRKLLL